MQNETKMETDPLEHKRTTSGVGLASRAPSDKCKFCCLNHSDTVVMQCGHGGICHECASKIWESSKKCHMCRGPISQLLMVRPGHNQTVEVLSSNLFNL